MEELGSTMQSDSVRQGSLANLASDTIVSVPRPVYVADGKEIGGTGGDLEVTMESTGPWLLSARADHLFGSAPTLGESIRWAS